MQAVGMTTVALVLQQILFCAHRPQLKVVSLSGHPSEEELGPIACDNYVNNLPYINHHGTHKS